ncbi:MAG: hypothetical protein COU07_01085 [Candidatus Harrisonbacteria bacterium CG10_big_fil_rev_8_21_14_0_10_40_38]|uniref:Uncharacterized protein n=1 Tax=Candidatus Harrisonbacteria bacterium CG10_big_fil_rev_8_21_14_0_10_40_38 TaxID=1974583 RepID=A0A2H0USU5_9BACT|nr:MAG: hypothetical protein COU07_01085 [Candidatus Harrisonbacteria bacterium CG10_big_fil_rev_8_21_14_0_10_40_38]
MKYFLSILLFYSFIFLSTFSPFFHGVMNHSDCIAASMNGVDCPEGNVFSYLKFHLGVFKSFAQILLVQPFLIFINLSVLLTLSFLLWFIILFFSAKAFYFLRIVFSSIIVFFCDFILWLSFYKTSPPYFLRA